MSFRTVAQFRPFGVVAPGFTDVDVSPGVVAGLTRSDVSPVAPFAALEADVSTAQRVVLGLVADDGDRVVVTYDADRSRVAIEVRVAGATRVLRRRKVALVAPYSLAFVVCENQVTALARTAAGWLPLVTERDKVAALVDLRSRETLGRFGYAWGGAAELAGVRAGLFAMSGLRDPHLVQHADGTPYLRGGTAFLTFTCAGLGHFRQAHMGVFALDLADPTRVEQVAQLYSRRDGLVLGDHAGQLVRDGDRWLLATSSWGDFDDAGVHVRAVSTTDDLLHGVHLLETRPVPLPTTHSSWDPGLTRIDGRWHLSFVESVSQRPFRFHPALCVGDGPDPWTDLSLVGVAAELRRCEGPVIVADGGRSVVLASDATGRRYPVFDLAMTRIGDLDAPYLTNIPHPQLIPLPDGGHLMVSFNGTQFSPRVLGYGGHGDVVVMRSVASSSDAAASPGRCGSARSAPTPPGRAG
jgi:hypothetical protein